MGTNLLILVVTLVLTLSGCAGELCEERKFSLLDSEDSEYKSCPGPDDPAHFTACCPGPVWSERSESCPLSPVSCPLSPVSCPLSLVSCLLSPVSFLLSLSLSRTSYRECCPSPSIGILKNFFDDDDSFEREDFFSNDEDEAKIRK